MKKLLAALFLLVASPAHAESDARLMQDIESLTNCSSYVKDFRAVAYKRTVAPSHGYFIGFVAHELQESWGATLEANHLENVVYGVEDGMIWDEGNYVPDYQSYQPNDIGVLVACALAESIANIETIESDVAALETEVSGLSTPSWSSITGKPSFATVATTGAYDDLTGKPTLFDGSWASLSGKPTTFSPSSHSHAASEITDFVANARASISVTGNGSYNSTTGVITVNNPSSLTYNNNVSRSLNSSYTISSTRAAEVAYSVNVSWNLSALLSGSASAFLEYSTDSGTTWVTVNQVSKNIGLLTFAGSDDLNLVGNVPAGASVRIRTTSSNMTVSYVRGQEVLQ